MNHSDYERIWQIVGPLLPKPPPRPRGGRRRLSNKSVLRGILFVLETGTPWEHLPTEMGCGSGMTCLRRLREWQNTGVWDLIRAVLLAVMKEAHRLDWNRFAACPNPKPVPRRSKKRFAGRVGESGEKRKEISA
ncbi:transposase [Alkalidesulfovibrio alkalitolerans]|uniref:transposase n=1 Tax=Alkalidesulfovibrio alkalitolerans TaxID=293256 RepID=UPI000A020739